MPAPGPLWSPTVFLQAWLLGSSAVSALPRAGARTAGHVLGFVGMGSRLRVANQGDAGGHADGRGQSQTILQSDREATVRLRKAQLQHGTAHTAETGQHYRHTWRTNPQLFVNRMFGIVSPDKFCVV